MIATSPPDVISHHNPASSHTARLAKGRNQRSHVAMFALIWAMMSIGVLGHPSAYAEPAGEIAQVEQSQAVQSEAAPSQAEQSQAIPSEAAPSQAEQSPQTETQGAAEIQAPPPKLSLNHDRIEAALGETTLAQRAQSLFGVFGLLFIAWLMSAHRRRVDWRLVGIGVGLQFLFGVVILLTPFGRPIFDVASAAFVKILNFTKTGSGLIFGAFDQLQDSLLNTLAFGVLPTIIFFSSLMAVLYHLGVMQWVVNKLAWAMQRTMRTSGSETLSAAANIFVGQTEAPLMIRPYVAKMTQSELMALMVGGFATVAGGVLAIYVGFLEPHFPGLAGHLLTASVLSAPAALVIAKILYPETEQSETAGEAVSHKESKSEKIDANIIDAAARGAGEGLTLTLNVAAMLLAFVALIAMINYVIALPSYLQHHSTLSELWGTLSASGASLGELGQCNPELVTLEGSHACILKLNEIAGSAQVSPESLWHAWSMQELGGYLFAPFALLIGIPYEESWSVGQLLGVKVVLNELLAYQQLTGLVKSGGLSPRSVIIVSYALCGFANFGSIAIQLGGIGGIAPERRGDLARLGLKAMWGGTLAALMTGAVVGVIL